MDVFRRIMDEANARDDERTRQKIYKYVMLDKNFRESGKIGRCHITNRCYDPCLDYNVISFVDIDTNEKFRICQFYVKFEISRI